MVIYLENCTQKCDRWKIYYNAISTYYRYTLNTFMESVTDFHPDEVKK